MRRPHPVHVIFFKQSILHTRCSAALALQKHEGRPNWQLNLASLLLVLPGKLGWLTQQRPQGQPQGTCNRRGLMRHECCQLACLVLISASCYLLPSAKRVHQWVVPTQHVISAAVAPSMATNTQDPENFSPMANQAGRISTIQNAPHQPGARSSRSSPSRAAWPTRRPLCAQRQ